MTKSSVFNIIDMHCSSCSITIDGDLEDTVGVKQATTSYAKSITTVTFDPAKISSAEIIKVIKKAGYTAKLTT